MAFVTAGAGFVERPSTRPRPRVTWALRMKPSVRSIAFGAVAILATGAVLLASAGSTAGCNSQQLAAQPDAAPAKCEPGPFLFGCDVVTADQPHCSSDDRSSTYIAKLPAGQNYPVGCNINYVGERDDIGGDCKLEQVCKCVLPDLVVPADDGGVDDSGVIAPAPTATGNPVWQCG